MEDETLLRARELVQRIDKLKAEISETEKELRYLLGAATQPRTASSQKGRNLVAYNALKRMAVQ